MKIDEYFSQHNRERKQKQAIVTNGYENEEETIILSHQKIENVLDSKNTSLDPLYSKEEAIQYFQEHPHASALKIARDILSSKAPFVTSDLFSVLIRQKEGVEVLKEFLFSPEATNTDLVIEMIDGPTSLTPAHLELLLTRTTDCDILSEIAVTSQLNEDIFIKLYLAFPNKEAFFHNLKCNKKFFRLDILFTVLEGKKATQAVKKDIMEHLFSVYTPTVEDIICAIHNRAYTFVEGALSTKAFSEMHLKEYLLQYITHSDPKIISKKFPTNESLEQFISRLKIESVLDFSTKLRINKLYHQKRSRKK